MAAVPKNLTKMVSAQLRSKANEFLNSRKHANNLADILQAFEAESDNYTPILLTIEVIFTELLKRGDLIEKIEPLKPKDNSAEAAYTRWLRECYERAISRSLECMKLGRVNSRLQALVTLCKLLQAEGRYQVDGNPGYYFPSARLKSIFQVLLDSEISMSAPITRFQEFTEYRDVQQYGLKVLSTIAYRKSPTQVYMQNYLDLLDKLLILEICTDPKGKEKGRPEETAEKVLCGNETKASFPYNAAVCRRYANKCWGFACQWPLHATPKTQRRALLLLVQRVLPLLTRPHTATDMLADTLDAGGPISMIALQGVLELVRHHNIDYPDMYDRLYAMFEPEMFATRYKRRLLHLTDVFLSSTHLPESLVAAFAKRIARLALVADEEDICGLLELVSNLLLRHPALKRMICHSTTPQLMSNDPYIMEETRAQHSNALGSSLWEIAALKQHYAPTVSAAAARVINAAEAPQPAMPPVSSGQSSLFDAELRKTFKAIELNFIRPNGMSLPSDERLLQYYELLA